MKKIVTIGEILVEIMAPDRGDGFRAPLRLVGPFPSGAPAIFIDQAAKLGQPCGMVGCVGDDDFGRLNIDRLRNDGVDVSGIAVDPEAATGSAFVRYRENGERDFVFNIKHSAAGRTTVDAAARSLVAGSDHLHIMGTSLFAPSLVDATRDAVAIIKDKGGTISFDPNIRREMLTLAGLREALNEFLTQCDIFLPSGPELFLFTNARTEEEAVSDILDGSQAGAIVVKRGPKGASYFDRTCALHQPAFVVEEIDPTGAGDCFGATFITCWLRGSKPADALAYACASGALAVTRQGPMEGTSTMAELEAFIGGTTSTLPS